MAILRCVTTDGYIDILQMFVNQYTDVKYALCTVMDNLKLINAYQAKTTPAYKNTTQYFTSVHCFTNFCNISMYPSFVTHLPEDGHMSGRNM